MIAIYAYVLLITLTVILVMMVRSIWKRTGDVSVLFGAGILYLWTFMGAWFFIGDAATGFMGYHIGLAYYYLMDKMFPFGLDTDYLITLAVYGAFSIALFTPLVVAARARGKATDAPVVLSREVLVITGLIALVISIWSILPVIRAAFHEEQPLYLLLHEFSGPRRSLHAFSTSAASVAFLFGLAVHIGTGSTTASFKEVGRWLPGWSYAAGSVLLCLYLSFTGDRHTLFGALVLAIIYLVNTLRGRAWRPALFLALGGGAALFAGGALRGLAWTDHGLVATAPTGTSFATPCIRHVPRHPSTLVGKAGEAILTNEMFCAHFSFYGIRTRHVTPEPGISFRYLAHSLGPASARPPTVYDHYASAAGTIPGQGYTIHHASAWFLNLGWAGPPVGGAVLGVIWLLLIRASGPRRSSGWLRLLPWLFVAYLPAVIRSGPEAYKGLLVEGLLLPLITLAPALWTGARLVHRGTAP